MKQLKGLQSNHEKVKHINYNSLAIQSYLKSHMNNEHKALLFSLRSHTVRKIKDNFHTFYKADLLCPICEICIDSQKHIMECVQLLSHIPDIKKHIKYDHIYGNIDQQIEVTAYMYQLLEVREQILEDGLPGPNNTGP